jgi:hypothetical protein
MTFFNNRPAAALQYSCTGSGFLLQVCLLTADSEVQQGCTRQ